MTFPILCVFFAFIILSNEITASINIDEFQVSDSPKSGYKYENLTRSIRQTGKGCNIPSAPPHTKYRISGKNEDLLRNYVEDYNLLDVICDNGYNIEPFAKNYSFCRNGKLDPPLTKCLRTCPSLTSLKSTNVNCNWNNPNGNSINLQNCINPVEGTTVSLSCNSFFEEPSIKKNPIRVCSNGKWDPPIAVCYPICGVKRPRGRTNVINGNNAEPGDYPWQVGVYNTQKDLICGGSILDYRVVLSAAHCFTDYDGNILSNNSYYIAAGKYYREYNDDRDKFGQYSKVLKIYVPARYRGINNLQGFDIAIVILADPLKITLRVQPVCIELFEESPDLHLSINKVGTVTGWGYTREGTDLSEVLKEVQIPYIPYDECYSAVPVNFRRFITHDKFCGGYLNNGTSVCGGDSGGGVIFKKLNSDQYFIKGIVSVSPATEGVCDSNQYSVYTSVGLYINFVRILLRYNEVRQNIECTQNDCANSNSENIAPEECTNSDIFTCRFFGKRSCTLPNFPVNGKYEVNQNVTYHPGNHVEQNSILSVSCDSKFVLSESGAMQSHCSQSGEWIPPLKTCIEQVTRKKLPNSETFRNPLLPNRTDCGIQDTDFNSGDTETELFEFPWIAILQYQKAGGDGYTSACGGVLINNRYVLTAAHCVTGAITKNVGTLKRVRLGEYDTSSDIDCLPPGGDDCNNAPTDVEVEETLAHQDYDDNSQNRYHDIALIRLAEDVQLRSSQIKAICLPISSLERTSTGATAFAAGWGFETDKYYPKKLKIGLPINDNGGCSTTFKYVSYMNVTNTQVCAGGGGRTRAACNGDNGGPLMATVRNKGKQWIVEGVLTYGPFCVTKLWPRIYTRVSEYLPWIHDNVKA